MSKLPKTKASTQQHLDVEDITQDLVILKTGWVAMVMATTAINFDLLSEAEQDATIYAFGAFLNSLSFPLQVLIRSKKADITAYFHTLEEAERTQTNPDLKRQIQKYQEFIQATVQQKTVLDKRFYLIINYSPLETGLKGFGGKKEQSGQSKAQLIAAAATALAPKRDHVIKQTARLGINTRQLTSQEIIELFYDIYNPAPTGTQRVILDAASYTTPLVEPAIANPTPASQVAVEQELTNINHPTQTVNLNQQPLPVQIPNLRPVPPASTPASTPASSSLDGRGELDGPPPVAPAPPQPPAYQTAPPPIVPQTTVYTQPAPPPTVTQAPPAPAPPSYPQTTAQPTAAPVMPQPPQPAVPAPAPVPQSSAQSQALQSLQAAAARANQYISAAPQPNAQPVVPTPYVPPGGNK